MNTNVITIARQYGSGGREIGEKIAKRLNVPFFDKKLIALAAKQSGISEEMFEKADEKAASSLLYSLVMGSYSFGTPVSTLDNMPINDRLFIMQSNIIREAAQNGPCVVVGRCADYILRDHPGCLHVFIHASRQARAKRAIEVYGDSPDKIDDFLTKKDKQRANYYNFYSNQKWGSPNLYHLSLDSAVFGIENTIELICQAAQMRQS